MVAAAVAGHMRAGVIVAGGRSTRFGDADKAVADLAGVPMIRRVADRIDDPVDELVVNCRADQRDAVAAALPPEARFALDPEPDLGPVAGLRAGLAAVRAEYAFVVACDMPFVEPALVEHLFERAAGCDAAVPRLDGWFQPLHAVYRSSAAVEACEAALARGDRKAIAPLEDLDHVVVSGEEVREHADPRTFENVNTREELAAAEERLA